MSYKFIIPALLLSALPAVGQSHAEWIAERQNNASTQASNTPPSPPRYVTNQPAKPVEPTPEPITQQQPTTTQSTQPPAKPTQTFQSTIAAIVENRIITSDDLQKKVIPFIPQIQRESRNQKEFEAKLAQAGRDVLESMIDDYLLIHEFNSNERLRIPETFLENHYNKMVKEQFDGDRSKFIEFLNAQSMTEREFREQQKEQVILSFVNNELRRSESEVSPDKIQKFYNENIEQFRQHEAVHLRQITLKPIPDDDPTQIKLKQRTQKILNRLKHREDFALVAKESSEDDMAKSGGNWGWINRDDIRKELADVAFKLSKGRFSNPIYLNNHAFILYVEDIREAGYLPLDQVRDRIEKHIINQHTQKARQDKLERLRKNAHIKYLI